jgi:hypothetical protein
MVPGLIIAIGPGTIALAQRRPTGFDRRPQGSIADGVELEVGMAHAGALVDPPSHVGSRPLTVELVGVGRGRSLGGEALGELATAAFERVDAEPGGVVEQIVVSGVELRSRGIVEVADRVGDRVDVTGRHGARRECIFETRQRRADAFAFVRRMGVFRRVPAVARQRVAWVVGPAFGSQGTLTARGSNLQRVAPTLQLGDLRG